LLHAVDAGSPDAIKTGDRVHVHWFDEPVGAITDIAYFVPGDTEEEVPAAGDDDRDPVTVQVSPSFIEIQHTASMPETAYLKALQEGKCSAAAPATAATAGPARCTSRRRRPTREGLALDEFIELPDKGTVTTLAVINIPFHGQRIKPPYVAATCCSRGRHPVPAQLVTEIDRPDVRMGLRVQAVWKPREEWGLGIDNIDYFKPTGEPDADYDSTSTTCKGLT
jgi:uncharacterized OB-fold protein